MVREARVLALLDLLAGGHPRRFGLEDGTQVNVLAAQHLGEILYRGGRLCAIFC